MGQQRYLEETHVAGAAWEVERKKGVRLSSGPHCEASWMFSDSEWGTGGF